MPNQTFFVTSTTTYTGSDRMRRCSLPIGVSSNQSPDEILTLLQTLNQQHGKTIIMVTHDPHASARASRIVYLDKGQLTGQPAD